MKDERANIITLKQVLTYYLRKDDFAEPLDYRGICFFCGAKIANAYGKDTPHLSSCPWLVLASDIRNSL